MSKPNNLYKIFSYFLLSIKLEPKSHYHQGIQEKIMGNSKEVKIK